MIQCAPLQMSFAYAAMNPIIIIDPFGLETFHWYDAYRPSFWAEGFRGIREGTDDLSSGATVWMFATEVRPFDSYDDLIFELAGGRQCPTSWDENLEFSRGLSGEAATVALITAGTLQLSGGNPSLRFAYHHKNHHTFKWLFNLRLPHHQLNWWWVGVKKSGGTIGRIPNIIPLTNRIYKWIMNYK